MAHEVENMFSVGETPWHRLGVVLEGAPSIGEGIRCAGLDWGVRKERLSLADGREVDAWATVRESDGQVLGHRLGEEYEVLQNYEAFSWFQPFLDSGVATLETAGSLRNGARVWVLARLVGEDVIVERAGDNVRRYLLLANGHDGSMAVNVGFSPIRVVCANTLAVAMGEAGGSLVRIRHTGKVRDTLGEVREVMGVATRRFEASVAQYRALAGRDVKRGDLERYTRAVFGLKERGRRVEASAGGGILALAPAGGFEGLLEEDRSRVVASVTRLFEGAGRGIDVAGVRGTWWAAYNSVQEHMQYEQRGNEGSRLDSLAWGPNSARNARALDVAMRMAHAA